LRQRLGGALITGWVRATAGLPLPLAHALGALLGWLLWWVPNTPRQIATVNLARCFPELDPVVRRRLLRRNLLETGKTLVELGPLWRGDRDWLRRLVRTVDGEAALAAALKAGRGAILVTPHLGSWEAAGLYYSAGYPLTILYRPNRLGLDALIRAGREHLGGRLVATDQPGVRALMQALRDNQVLGILPDQDPGRGNGQFAPFFGLPANTMTLVSRLAQRSGAPVLLTYTERLPRGRGYRLVLEALPAVVTQGPLEASLTALNAAVEQAVRRLPAQYLWSYKRFKTRPGGQTRFY
jgi:KDO2-lipid IV(A) lauroyltransferase